MTDTIQRDKKFWTDAVAGIKKLVSKNEEDLDAAGIERKAIDVTPEIVDDLRTRLCAAFPAMCEGEGEAVAEIMQVITDALAEAQPETDVAEERAEGDADEEPMDEDEDEKDSEIIKLTRQVAEMGKAYNELIEDVSEIVQLTSKALTQVNAETKARNEFEAELAAIKKQMGERPRRASQAPETKLDPKSELAKSVKERDTSNIPSAFADMFEGAT